MPARLGRCSGCGAGLAMLSALWLQLLLLAAAPADAAGKPTFVQPAVPSRVIVRLTETPVAVRLAGLSGSGGGAGPARRLAAAETAASAAVAAQQAAVLGQLAQLTNARTAVRVEQTYSQTFNGFSISLVGGKEQRAAQLAALKAVAGVAGVAPVKFYRLPPRITSDGPRQAARTVAHAAKKAARVARPAKTTIFAGEAVRSRLANKAGITGKGIHVAIIDSGVDYTHPDLGGGLGSKFRVRTGYDFVGDNGLVGEPPADDSTGEASYELFPDADPMDTCNGHGTAVAGLLAGRGNLVGIAPGVTLGAYRVFSCATDATGDDIIIAAVERAYRDGAKIINLSLGGSAAYPGKGAGGDLGLIAQNLQRLGVFVVAAGGNDGNGGLFTLGNVEPSLLTVGASADAGAWVHSAIANPGRLQLYYTRAQLLSGGEVKDFPLNKALPLVVPGAWRFSTAGKLLASPDSDACDDSLPAKVRGKIAIIARRGCLSVNKLSSLRLAGALGALFVDDQLRGFTLLGANDTNANFPAAFLTQAAGLALIRRSLTGRGTITFQSGRVRVSVPAAQGRLAQFTSNGPAADLSFGPDFAAPGLAPIITTEIVAFGGYQDFSGTSAATPEAAGCVALLKQRFPRITLAEVRQRIQNTAIPYRDAPEVTPPGTPESLQLAPVTKQGAGVIDIYSALTTKQFVEPPRFALGDISKAVSRKITVRNTDTRSVTFAISHVATLAQNYDIQTARIAPAAVKLSKRSIVVRAKSSVSFIVTITPPKNLLELGIFGGYVVLKLNSKPERVLRVPYYGLKGNYQKVNPVSGLLLGAAGPPPDFGDFQTSRDDVFTDAGPTYGSWAGVNFNFNTTYPTAYFQFSLPVQRLTGVITQLSAGMKLRFVDKLYPDITELVQVPYFFINTAIQPATRQPGISNFNFRCALANGLYSMTFTLIRPRGTAKNPLVISHLAMHFRVNRPKGVGAGAVYCNTKGIPTVKG